MTLAGAGKSGEREPRWEEEDVDLTASGSAGEDIVVELRLEPDECSEHWQYALFRGDVPMPSDRYQIQTRGGNVVQLTLKQSQKEDSGHYALVAKKLSSGGLSISGDERAESRHRIRLTIQDPTSSIIEEGEPPIFLRRPSDLAVKVGTRTRFLVEIRSSASPKVTWHKNDEPLQSGSRFSFVHEGNFYCVDVAPVMVDDQGHWTCMAENGSGRSSCTSFLSVIVPKAYKKPEFVEELRAILTETGTVSLECKVVGVPTPVLKWFKDQKEIKAGDVFALSANPDDPTSLGTYTCEAVNCMGTGYSSSRVHVMGKGSREGSLKPADALTPTGPLPLFRQILRDESCRIGDTLVLACQVNVPPWPKDITWYNKEGKVEPGEKYNLRSDGLGGYSIEIKGVEAMDEGEWKCVATSTENMKQFSTCHVAMSIPKNYRMPRFMESLKAVLTEEGLVSFECKVVGFPTPLLRWFKDGQELHPGDVYQLTGTNSLGSYCCIARNCMGEAKSVAELTVEDIQNQLNEEERMQLTSSNQAAPKFVKGLRSCEARINEDFTFTIQVSSVSPDEPSLSWYRDDVAIIESERYRLARQALGTCNLEVKRLEFVDQAEWKCVAANDFGHSATSCFLKLVIPKHFKKPKFLESLRAILSEEGAVNLECKVIGVPQPILKWYKDGIELKPGDIHRIISGQDGTCCLGTYTCEATNCMGSVSSSASLLGFEDRVSMRKEEAKEAATAAAAAAAAAMPPLHELARNLSLSTIHEERTSQLYDTPQTDHSITMDDRGEVSFSFDGKEVSVSLYETPDLTEEEALQIVEMYADQLSEHITEGNVIELPPMRFTKETSTTGNLLMEAVVIDVSPDYFVPDEEGDDLRTEADVEDVSIMDDQMQQSVRSLLSYVSSPSGGGGADTSGVPSGSPPPSRPPRRKESRESFSSRSDKSLAKAFDWSESYHSAREPSMQAHSSAQAQDDSGEAYTDALSSSARSKPDESKDVYASLVEQNIEMIALVDETLAEVSKRDLNVEGETIVAQIGQALLEQVPLKEETKKRKKKRKSKSEGTAASRTPSLSSKASSEESNSPDMEETTGGRGRRRRRQRRASINSGERRGSLASSDKSEKDRRESGSESGNFETAAGPSPDLRRRESDATIMVDDVKIERIEDIVCVERIDKIEIPQPWEKEQMPASESPEFSTNEFERSSLRSNKERILESVHKLSEPIMSLRNALVDIDNLLPLLQTQESPTEDEKSRMEIDARIVHPIENLCEQVSAIETKALKSAGDRSLAQNVRISLLETIGGPTEELLRGIELIRRHSGGQRDAKSNLIILESLTEPVDEILVGLTRIEKDLCSGGTDVGESVSIQIERPIALERMSRAVSRLVNGVQMMSERKVATALPLGDDEATSFSVIERLESVCQSLEAFVSTVPLTETSGALENNVDTLVVESLVRPIEQLSRKLDKFGVAALRTPDARDDVAIANLETSMVEMRTRLEALSVALETYERESGEQGITELHADLVNFLRYTMDDASERLAKLKTKRIRVSQESQVRKAAAAAAAAAESPTLENRANANDDESAIESLESEETNIMQELAEETAGIMKSLTVPMNARIELAERDSGMLEAPSLLPTIDEKSSPESVQVPPPAAVAVTAAAAATITETEKPSSFTDDDDDEAVRERAERSPSGEKTEIGKLPEIDTELSLPEMLLDPLIDVQANLSDVISDFESQESAGEEECSLPGNSELAACLTELRECVATAAHTATSLKSGDTVDALVDLREPLLDLQLAMTSAVSPAELKLIGEATAPLSALKVILGAVIGSPQTSAASQLQIKSCIRMLEDIEAEVTKISTPVESSPQPPPETKTITTQQRRPPEEVERAAIALTGVHFALSSVLERVSPLPIESDEEQRRWRRRRRPQDGEYEKPSKMIAERSGRSNLIVSIDELRQSVGKLAVAVASPVLVGGTREDRYSYEIAFDELAKLEEPLLNLQRVLLTEQHDPEDRHLLNDLAAPIRSLKEIVQNVTSQIAGATTPPHFPHAVLDLIEDVEKDVTLIAMEALKRALATKSELVAASYDNDPRASSISSSSKPGEIPGVISTWLDPIEHWLTNSCAEEQTTEQIDERPPGRSAGGGGGGGLAPVIDNLKRDLLKIAIRTSYSEPPSDAALIESLTELCEPIARAYEALVVCHGPENLEIVEGLVQPAKHLLGTILDASVLHEAGKVLRPVLEAIEELDNQIPLTIKRIVYERELQRVVRSMTPDETLMAEDCTAPPSLQPRGNTAATVRKQPPGKSLARPLEKIAAAVSQVQVEMEELVGSSLDEYSTSLEEDKVRAKMVESSESSARISQAAATELDEAVQQLEEAKRSSPEESAIEQVRVAAMETGQGYGLRADETSEKRAADAVQVHQVKSLESAKSKAETNTTRAPRSNEHIPETESAGSIVRGGAAADAPEESSEVKRAETRREKNEASTAAAEQEESTRFVDSNNSQASSVEVITVDSRPLAGTMCLLESGKTGDEASPDTTRADQLDLWTLTLLGPLDRLGNAVLSLDRSIDELAHGLLCRPLDSLHKQIEIAESQFNRPVGQSLENDVETIIEGFLSPVNQLHSALSAAVNVWNDQQPRIVVRDLLRSIADSSTELCELLDTLRKKLTVRRAEQTLQEQQEDASLVETINAVVAPLEDVKNLIEDALKSLEFVESSGEMELSSGRREEQQAQNETIREGGSGDDLLEAFAKTRQGQRTSVEGPESPDTSIDKADIKSDEDTLASQDTLLQVEEAEELGTFQADEATEPSLRAKVPRAPSAPLTRAPKVKEDSMDIEETTAKPLEELIEAILVDSSVPRPVSSSPETPETPSALTAQVPEENDEKREILSAQEEIAAGFECTVVTGENLATAEIPDTDTVVSENRVNLADNIFTELAVETTLQEVQRAEREKKDRATVVGGENLSRVEIIAGPEIGENVTEILSKAAEVGEITEPTKVQRTSQAAEDIVDKIQEEILEEARIDCVIREKAATFLSEDNLAMAEAKEQKSLTLETCALSQENFIEEGVTEIPMEKVTGQSAELSEGESLVKVAVADTPELRIKPNEEKSSRLEPEAAEMLSLFEVTFSGQVDEAKAKVHKGESLPKADVTSSASEVIIKENVAEPSRFQVVDENVRDTADEKTNQQKAQVHEEESPPANAAVTDPPELGVQPREAKSLESEITEECACEISIEKVQALMADLGESETLAKAEITNASETRLREQTVDIAEESIRELVMEKSEQQRAEIGAGESNPLEAVMTGVPEINIRPIDSGVSQSITQVAEESVREIPSHESNEQKAAAAELRDESSSSLARAVTDVAETREAEQHTAVADSVEDRRCGAQIAKIVAAEVAKMSEELVIEAAKSAIVEIIETPTHKVFKLKREGTGEEEIAQIVEKIVVKPVEEVVSMEDRNIVQIVETPSVKAIKVRIPVEGEDTRLVEVIEEIVVKKPVEGWAKSLVEEEEERAVSVSETKVEEFLASSVPPDLLQVTRESAQNDGEEIKYSELEESERLTREGDLARKTEAERAEQEEIARQKIIREEKLLKREEEEHAKQEREEKERREETERLEREELERQEKSLAEAERVRQEEEEKLREKERERREKEEQEAAAAAAAELVRKEEERLRKEEENAAKLRKEEAEKLERTQLEKAQKEKDAEKLRKEESERLEREESERRKQEAERAQREAAEKWEKEESERRAQEEAERARKEETERLEREEMRKRQEEENLKKEEEERRAKEEAEKLEREEREAERLKQEQLERAIKEEEEKRRQKEEAEKLEREKEAEKLKVEELERAKKKEEEERRQKEEAERLEKEKLEREKLEAERLKQEELERAKKEEERLKEEEADRLKKDEVERAKKEEDERLKKEEAEKLEMEKLERAKRDEEERIRKEEADKLEKEKLERAKKEEEERLKREAAEKLEREKLERAKKEEEERLKREAAEKLEREKLERAKEEEEEEERLEKEEAEKLEREKLERAKKDEVERLKKEEAEKLEREKVERAKKEEEERIKKEKADKLEMENLERAKKEEEERLKKEDAEKVEKESLERAKKEQEERLEREEAEKVEREQLERAKKEEEERLKKEEAERLEKEKVESAKKEEERLKRQQAERLEREKLERAKKEEEGRLKKAEAERVEKEKVESAKKEEEARLKEEEAEKLAHEKLERMKKEEDEQLKKEEAAKLEKEEQERAKKEEERVKREKEDRLKREEEERLKREEKERVEREEEERLQREEMERLENEKLERARKEKEQQLKKEKAEKLEKEKLKGAKKAEEERLKREEAEKLEREKLDRSKKEEEERVKREEAEKLEKDKLEREKQEAETLKREELERARKEEEERLKREEAEQLEKEKLNRAKKEDEQRVKREEADKLEKEKLERDKQEAERLKHEESVRAKEKEERLKKEEGERLEKEKLERARKEEEELVEREKREQLEREKQENERKKQEEFFKKEELAKLARDKLEREEAESRKREEEEKFEKEKQGKEAEAAELGKNEEAAKLEKEKLAKEKEDAEKQKKKEQKRAEREKKAAADRLNEEAAERQKIQKPELEPKTMETEKSKKEEQQNEEKAQSTLEQKTDAARGKEKDTKEKPKDDTKHPKKGDSKEESRTSSKEKDSKEGSRRGSKKEESKQGSSPRVSKKEVSKEESSPRASKKEESKEGYSPRASKKEKSKEESSSPRASKKRESKEGSAPRVLKKDESSPRVSKKAKGGSSPRITKKVDSKEGSRRTSKKEDEPKSASRRASAEGSPEEGSRRDSKKEDSKDDSPRVSKKEAPKDEAIHLKKEDSKDEFPRVSKKETPPKHEVSKRSKKDDVDTSKDESRRLSKRQDSNEATRPSSRKEDSETQRRASRKGSKEIRPEDSKAIAKVLDDEETRPEQVGAFESPPRVRKDVDDKKTRINPDDAQTSERHVRLEQESSSDRGEPPPPPPPPSSTIRTDSELDSEHSESTTKSMILRDQGLPPKSRRRRSGQLTTTENESLKERHDRQDTERQLSGKLRDDTLSSDDQRHCTSHYSTIGTSREFTPGPRDRGKKPSFCTKLTDRTAAEGLRIKLTCTVLGDPEPGVYWTKDGRELPSSSNRHCTIEEYGMCSLELYAAQPKDSGEYSCVAQNIHGLAHTEAKLKVYAGYEPLPTRPTFTRSIKDTYRTAENELVLECRVRGQPSPNITWLKDGQVLQIGDRYQQSDLGDGICRLQISRPDFYDSGLYSCRAENDSKVGGDCTSHVVNFDGKDGTEHGPRWRGSYRSLTSSDRDVGRPRFSSYLTDHSVPAGGTIALQVEVKGVPQPDITWMRGDKREPIPAHKVRTFADAGVYTLIVPEATESETGTYVCRASNAYGFVDTSANVEVVSSCPGEGGKPAMFVSRPAETMIHVTAGEDVSVSFRISGLPKPRIVWMKGLRDITNGPRSYKESSDDYVRLTLKRATIEDEGTYCIMAKNRYGCDRSFYTVKVKQRARSLTPSPDWGSLDTDNLLTSIHDTERSYLKQVPGAITSEPVVVDGGRNWLALSWGKAVQHGPAPVVAYRVDAWLLGGEGGARWAELGMTPVNAFDAFNLRPGGEYKFRVTPRNRYGWGETVTMRNSVTVREVVKFPEFTKILAGQLKALRGETLRLECEVRSSESPRADVKWYRDTTDVETIHDPRHMTHYHGLKCTMTIQSIKESDSGRYVCEATNPAGRVSTFARVQVVTDPKIVEADEKLRRMRTLEPSNEERPPEFTMRLRDRRVQMTYPVRLTCQVSGHPEPEVTWYKNREKIYPDDNISFWDDESHFHTLEISHSSVEDSGIYMAKARNLNGSVSCRCDLVVDKGIRAYVGPEFLRHLDAVYTVKLNGELRMSAQIEAYPTVGIVWHRDGHRLRPSRSTVMTLNHDGSVELSLAHVTPRDAGLYCCTATNEVGRAESTTRVTVIGSMDEEISSISQSLPDAVVESLDVPYSKEPVFVTKPLSTEAFEGDTVIILCEVIGDPKPEVIWLRDFLRPDYYRDAPHFRRVGAGPQYRLEIPYAKLDFTGAYTVIAKNCHGEAKAIISLQIYARGQGKSDSGMEHTSIKHGKVQTLPSIKQPLRDLRCCDGDAVTLICRVHATPEPDVRWEKSGKLVPLGEDFAADFDGETARLSIQHVYPEDEGEYTCVAYNDLGKAFTSACLIVDVPEGKESALSRRLIRPIGLLSGESTPISTPRSTPIRSLSPACVISSRREVKPAVRAPRSRSSLARRPRLPIGPKFYAVPHNRVAEEGETVRFQCAIAGHPTPWLIWDKDGVPVSPTTRISLVEKDDVRILEIAEVNHEDAGLYRITLENDVGRTEATARLEIIRGRQGSLARTVRTRSASPRTYSIYSRSPISSAVRSDTHLRPYAHDGTTARRGGTLSPTLPRWHHRNGKSPTDVSPGSARRTNNQIRTTRKNGTAEKPLSRKIAACTEARSSSVVPRQHPIHDKIAVNAAKSTTKSLPPRQTNEGNRRSKKGSKPTTTTTTTTTTTNGSMIPKRVGSLSRSRSPKVSEGLIGSPREYQDLGSGSSPREPRGLGKPDGSYEMSIMPNEKIVTVNNNDTIEFTALEVSNEELSDTHKQIQTESSRFIVENTTRGPRPPVILAAPADVVALRGTKVMLLATFDGEPQPRVRWLRKGRDVRLDDKAEIETGRGLTCLTLEGVTTEQTGKYAVTLENIAGRDCRYVDLTVEGVPDPPAGKPCVQSVTRSGKAIVTWRSPSYDGGCAVTGYSVEMKRSEDPCWIAVAEARHSLSHTVTGLETENTYSFRVRAENAHGLSEPGATSDVVTVPGENDEEIGTQVFTAEINQIEIEEEEDEFEPTFEARVVSPEDGNLFGERYEVKEELGKGRYGLVRRIVEKSSGLTLAAKFVRTIKAKDRQQAHEEIDVMNRLRHPKLLRLAAAYENPKEMIMVTEYISGGELFERVVADDFTLTEKDSILFVKQICEGVEYMHSRSVVHLDLKPENIMCHTRTSHRIKLIDFGLAQTLNPDTPVRVLIGTPEFIPPEIIGYEPIGTESDMWSVGVICYVLLTGLSPFMGDNDAETFANITRADYDFDDKAFTAISAEAKDFISALLVKRKELRMSAKQCLEHPWLAQQAESMSSVALPTDKLKKFIVRRKWQTRKMRTRG